MKDITEKIEKLQRYISCLPLTKTEARAAGIAHDVYLGLKSSATDINEKIKHQMLKSQYKVFKKLAKNVEIRLFRNLTPFDAFIYRYLLKKKEILPIYSIYNFSNEEINQRLEQQISIGIQEIATENGLMPSLASKLHFTSYNGLLNTTKKFFNATKPDCVAAGALHNFLDRVFENYNYIPYHNFAHAVNVLQFFEHMLKRTPRLFMHYSPEKRFWTLVACICHDITHYSKNNAYYLKKKHNLAFKSLEKSVLEHYHCEKTLKIMSREDCDLMAQLAPEDKSAYKRVIIDAILATDMARHFSLIEQFNTLDLKKALNDDEFSKCNGFLIHSSDVANPALDFDNYLLWAELVSQEFNLQTISEKKHGLDVTPFFEYGGREAFLKSQCGFINNFVMPLFKAISDKTGNEEFEEQCKDNVKTLTTMLEQNSEKAK